MTRAVLALTFGALAITCREHSQEAESKRAVPNPPATRALGAAEPPVTEPSDAAPPSASDASVAPAELTPSTKVPQKAVSGICDRMRRWLVYAPEKQGECNAERCKAAGGACGYAGMSCPVACIRRTTDGGKPCSDDAECQTGCYTDEDAPAGEPARGHCHPLSLALGCMTPVRGGKAVGAVCAD